MIEPTTQLTLMQAIFAVALSDISLAFDNALANAQMAIHLPARQQRRALLFGMLFSCFTMVILTFIVVQIRTHFDWVRYPAGLWLIYVVFKLWFEKEKKYEPHQLGGAMMKAVLLISITNLTMSADNAIANSEFATRAGTGNLWTVLIFGLLISCAFMVMCTYAIVWVRRYADWVKYPAGLWLLVVAALILIGKGAHH